jgi:arsenate reductase-like glutaredoxin family protein
MPGLARKRDRRDRKHLASGFTKALDGDGAVPKSSAIRTTRNEGEMTIEILGLRTCDTCRKALKALPGAILRDVRADPLSAAEIAELLAAFPESLVNKASTTWRGLSETERQQNPADLLAAHPSLMKRPVIRSGESVYLGWTPTIRDALGAA